MCWLLISCGLGSWLGLWVCDDVVQICGLLLGFCGGVSARVSGLLVLDLAFSLGFVVICVWRLGALFCGLVMVCLSCWFLCMVMIVVVCYLLAGLTVIGVAFGWCGFCVLVLRWLGFSLLCFGLGVLIVVWLVSDLLLWFSVRCFAF